MGLFALWFWLTAGSLAYQAVGPHDWDKAFQIAFYQASALIAVYLTATLRSYLDAPSHHH